MNIIFNNPIASGMQVVLAMALLTTGCKDNAYSASSPVAVPSPIPNPLPSTTVTITPLSSPIGMVPAGPTKEAPATTSPAKSNVSKADQSTAMPMPGQANDHSVLLPNWTQKPKNSP